jgi:hypothetical protein
MRKTMLWAALVGVALGILPFGTAVAYIGENPYLVNLDAPREVACGESVTITARVRSSDTSDPAVQQIVLWDLKETMSPEDSLTPAETVTNDDGETSAVLSFGEVSGERTVRVEIATWPTTIRVSCVGSIAVASPSAGPSPSASPTAAPSATPSAAPTVVPSPTPSATPAPITGGGSMTSAILPLALVVLVASGLGAMLLFLRRR